MRSLGSIVLVEDDRKLAKMIQQFLEREGYEVCWFSQGNTAVDHILTTNPDLIVLDIMLPGIDGVEICRRIRQGYANPVLMMTAKDDDLTEVSAMNTGADSYLTKPVRPHRLLAHIRALMRRQAGEYCQQLPHVKQIQDLTIDLQAMSVVRGTEKIALSSGLFQLLSVLTEHVGTVVSRDRLYRQLRGMEYDGVDRSIDLRLSALRKKLGDDVPPFQYIKTLRGQGYLLIP